MRRCLSLFVFLLAVPIYAAPLEFQLAFEGKAFAGPFNGRVHVALSKSKVTGPPTGPSWFRPQPMFARDVKGWKPGETVSIGNDALGYPQLLAKLDKGTYWVVAFMDLDRGYQSFGAAPGNVYSTPKQVELDPETTGPVQLVLDQVVQE